MDSSVKDVGMNGFQELKNIQQFVQNVKALIGTNLERTRNLNFFNQRTPAYATMHVSVALSGMNFLTHKI
jgi:hypothetical protein